MTHYRIWIAYDGTHFSGWQLQKGQRTVQEAIHAAFLHITQKEVAVRVAGRTDSGVHARAQAFDCDLDVEWDTRKLLLALNSTLPKDVAVRRVDVMPEGFDARRHAVGKRYIYRILPGSARDPFVMPYVWHMPKPIDIKAMHEAAQYLVGNLDFESFRSSICDAAHALRYLWRVNVEQHGEEIRIDVRGNAFCHNQVRIMAGTLVDIGQGRFAPSDVPQMLAARDRTKAGKTAPPHGLVLDCIYYPDDLSHAEIPEGAKFPRFPVTPETWPF